MKLRILGLLVGLVLATHAQSDDLPPDTIKRKDAILKRFNEEWVALTPGKGKFPAAFTMGSNKDGRENERPAHKVTFAGTFSMAKYEVTQELYFVVMGANPSKWKGPRNSVEMIDWDDAANFCRNVTDELRKLNLIGVDDVVRLPTEAEWEYACRAGSTTAYSFGDDVADLGKHAWYKPNSPGNDPPVGKKLPNAWGLYDMHGYVWEWCADCYHDDYKDAPTDGSAWFKPETKTRVIRGGSFADPAEQVRSAFRRDVEPTTKSDTIGFRCVLSKK
ncbi:MAG: formylglycine-generating enzyme family protein [Planctomycetes bacterium]|nr:formylglycine-generating enzyme family protein [Planctomycetota bacterium]